MIGRRFFGCMTLALLIFNICGCSTSNENKIIKEYKESSIKSGQAIELNQFKIIPDKNYYYNVVGYYNGDVYAIKYKKIPFKISEDVSTYSLEKCEESNYLFLLKNSGEIKKTNIKINNEYLDIFNFKMNGKIFSSKSESYLDIRTGNVTKIDTKYISECGSYSKVVGNTDYFCYTQFNKDNSLIFKLVNYKHGNCYKMKVDDYDKYESAEIFYNEKSKDFFMIIGNQINKISFKSDNTFELIYYDTLKNFNNTSEVENKNIKPVVNCNGCVWFSNLEMKESTANAYFTLYNIDKKSIVEDVSNENIIINDSFNDGIMSISENYFISAKDDRNIVPKELKCFDEEGIRNVYDLSNFSNNFNDFKLRNTKFFITSDNKAIISVYASKDNQYSMNFIILDLSY